MSQTEIVRQDKVTIVGRGQWELKVVEVLERMLGDSPSVSVGHRLLYSEVVFGLHSAGKLMRVKIKTLEPLEVIT